MRCAPESASCPGREGSPWPAVTLLAVPRSGGISQYAPWMPRLGVVVVTYRSATTIGACLSSLRGAAAETIEIVVVDNASDDDSLEAAAAADAAAVLLNRPSNDGYGVGNNAGVAALAPDTELVLFANPDTVWPAGSLDGLTALLDPAIGLLSPTLAAHDGTVHPIVERDYRLRDVVLSMVRLRPPIRPRWAAAQDDVVDVEWLHTAAALVPMDVVRRTGGFDERFFLFGEDADFCRRVRALGLRVAITPRIVVTHVAGASVDAANTADTAAALRTRALSQYIEKYQGRLARRAFGFIGTVVYGLGGHRGQAREALRALVR